MHVTLASIPVQLALQLIVLENATLGNFSLHSEVSEHNVEVPDGYTAFPDIGLAYKYCNNSLSWNMARKHCISEGGSLAVIDSFKKVGYASIVQGDYYRNPWIGIHKSFDGTEWVSLKTGLPLAFIPWSPDAKISADQHCTGVSPTGVYAGNNCKGAWAHLCEIPIGKQPLNLSFDIPDASGLEAN